MKWHVGIRMDFIGQTLLQKGYINRSDLMKKFDISTPQASKDLKDYTKLLPEKIEYNFKLKRYERPSKDTRKLAVKKRGRPSKEPTGILRVPIRLIPEIKKLIEKETKP